MNMGSLMIWEHHALPTKNKENIHIDAVPCSIAMLVNGAWSPVVPLSVPKGPSQFPNIFLLQPNWVLVSTPLFGCTVLVLGGHQQVLDGVLSSKINLFNYFVTNLFETLTVTLTIEDHIRQALLRCNCISGTLHKLHTKIITISVPAQPTFQASHINSTVKPATTTMS